MKRTILVLVLSAAGFAAVWRFEPTPFDSTAVAQPPAVVAPPGGSGTPAEKVVSGTAEASDYGTVQVQVVFSGSAITDIQLLQQPHSGRAVDALPELRQEALKAQSANIDTVSGATSTSESYVKSLQAALDAKGA